MGVNDNKTLSHCTQNKNETLTLVIAQRGYIAFEVHSDTVTEKMQLLTLKTAVSFFESTK